MTGAKTANDQQLDDHDRRLSDHDELLKQLTDNVTQLTIAVKGFQVQSKVNKTWIYGILTVLSVFSTMLGAIIGAYTTHLLK